jgi:glucose/arabinose dehydrogenase
LKALSVFVLIISFIVVPLATGAQVVPVRPVIVADGFEFNVFADTSNVPEFARSAFTGPTSLAFDRRGRLFVGTLSDKVLILLDNNDDGRLDEIKTFATGVPQVLGLEFRSNGDLFITSNQFASVGGRGRIIRLRDLNGDDDAEDEGEKTIIVDDLPSQGNHQTDRLKFGPEGLLYFTQGSATDDGNPLPGRPAEQPLNAKVLRIDVDSPAPQIEIIASGLRNPFGIAFHPENNQLFSTDASAGEFCQFPPCRESQPDEVNWIVPGGNYGFPQCEGTPLASEPGCAGVRGPIQQFLKHLTPTAIAFYTGPQAGADRNQMLVTIFKHLFGQGGELRRFTLIGDPQTGFQLSEVRPPIADFGIIDPGDGPVDVAIHPITGDIYAVRTDTVTHIDPNVHNHAIYRIHRAGSDALPLIGPVRPAAIRAGAGSATITVIGRHLGAGAFLFNVTDNAPLATREGADRFELVADLPAGALDRERAIVIEARNVDGSRSNQQQLLVTARDPDPDPDPGDPAPQISSLLVYKKKPKKVVDPLRVGAATKKLRLSVTGIDFDSSAELLVNGVALDLVIASSTQLVGKFKNGMTDSAGELNVQVRNPDGKISNTLKLIITN